MFGEYIGSIHTLVRNMPLVVEMERVNFRMSSRAKYIGSKFYLGVIALPYVAARVSVIDLSCVRIWTRVGINLETLNK